MQYGDFALIYDKLMADVDYDTWADYLSSFIVRIGEGARVAECACGTGAVTIRLKKAGYNISGFDISHAMLEIAAQNARNAGLVIPFVCMDMQKLVLHRPHDVIFSACDGVNYLSSTQALQSFFTCAFENLKSGGLLLFDISSRYKLEHVLGCNTFAEDDGDCAYIWKNMYDPVAKLIEMNLSFYRKNGSVYDRFCERHVQRAHSVEEVSNALQRAGFSDIEVYEAFTSVAPKTDTERIQFAAKKP